MGKIKKKRKDRRVKSVDRAASKDHDVNTSNDEKKQKASVIDVSRNKNESSSREASTSAGGKRSHSVPEDHSKSSKKRKQAPEAPDPPVEGQDAKGKNWLSYKH